MLSKKIIFITGNLTQPRVIKRIKAFKEQGFDICVYGFDRGTFQNVNVLSSDCLLYTSPSPRDTR